MKIGVLIDDGHVSRWQAAALREIGQGNEFILFDCSSTQSPRRLLRHALYYVLNLFTIRNHQTERVAVPNELAVVEHLPFAAEADGAWQRLPDAVLDRIAEQRPDVVLKFGMGLLRVPDDDRLSCPILSYHHGDPREFRGRPAGFYELLTGQAVLGQIVQILSNRLDAGRIVGFAQSKVQRHSYRQTLIEAYRCSPLILRPSIEAALANRPLPMNPVGKNYRLPSNGTVLRFLAKLMRAKMAHLCYGGLFEKTWRVAETSISPRDGPAALKTLDQPRKWRVLAQPPHYTFLADPFYDPAGTGILVEAMRNDGRGEIVCVDGESVARFAIDGGHCSYPASVDWDGKSYIVAETSGWSTLRLFERTADGVADRGELDIHGAPRLLDPTFYREGDTLFLFANRSDEGDGVLRLWTAASLFGRFCEHPASPIRVSPAGARMGGPILALGDGAYRVGQDFRGGYGDGIIVFRIDKLARDSYCESEVTSLRFASHRGPHTLSIRQEMALFDFYDDKFSLLAGVRRLRQRRAGKTEARIDTSVLIKPPLTETTARMRLDEGGKIRG